MGKKQAISVLIIDDKEKLCNILAKDFQLAGYTAAYALNSSKAMEYLSQNITDVILLDCRLGEECGLDTLKTIKIKYPDIPVIMVTGYGSIDNAVEAVKMGAWDYIQKPANFTKIQRTVTNATSQRKLQTENRQLKQRISKENQDSIIFRSMTIAEILNKLKKLSATDFPVLITGESGTGKELFADFVHNNSGRNHREIFKINCAAIAYNLLDNELFGHEKGAYTGADSVYKGIFERAEGGTLFLDELGDMPLEIQAKILRVLQNQEIRRLGGKGTIKVDVRVIAATNKNIQKMVENGDFREDLFYRLNLAEISIPPLRDRKDDIALLAGIFLEELSRNWGTKAMSMSHEVLEFFDSYLWPGNVRELKNVIHYMATVSGHSMLGIKELPQRLLASSSNDFPGKEVNPRHDLEEKMIRETLSKCKFNKKQTAERLKMSRKTLYNKIAKYGIEA